MAFKVTCTTSLSSILPKESARKKSTSIAETTSLLSWSRSKSYIQNPVSESSGISPIFAPHTTTGESLIASFSGEISASKNSRTATQVTPRNFSQDFVSGSFVRGGHAGKSLLRAVPPIAKTIASQSIDSAPSLIDIRNNPSVPSSLSLSLFFSIVVRSLMAVTFAPPRSFTLPLSCSTSVHGLKTFSVIVPRHHLTSKAPRDCNAKT